MDNKNYPPDELFSLLKQELKKEVPVGFYLVRSIKADRGEDFVTIAKSTFHQTDLFRVGAYYKPIAFVLDENKIIHE